MQLRDYQQGALDAVYLAIARGVNRPAVVMATGLGKTVVFSHLIAQWCARNPAGRVLVLVHRDELAQQARSKIREAEPGLEVGIVKAGQNEVAAQVIVASVQTVAKEKRRDQIRGVTLIVVDECHHAAARTWRQTLEHFGAWAGVPCVGWTATMHREDGKGLGEIWQEVVYRRDIRWAVGKGWLVRPRGLRVRIPQLHLEDKSLKVRGEYQKDRLASAMISADTGPAIVRAVEQFGPARRYALFGPNVESVENFSEHLNAAGFRTETIFGSTAKHERLARFARFETGHTQILSTAMVLTEGWDAPHCDGIIWARPTTNPALVQQGIGRAIRLHGVKEDGLILFMAGGQDVPGLVVLDDLGIDEEIVTPRNTPVPLDGDDLLDPDTDPYEPEVSTPAPIQEVAATEVDWFGQSKFRWLSTSTGVEFLMTGSEVVFVWTELGGHKVGYMTLNSRERAVELGVTFDITKARVMAEEAAQEMGYVHRTEAWRRKPATWNHTRTLHRHGIVPPQTATTGEVQDMIDIVLFERKLGVRV